MNILVTGASGFIGRALCAQLQSDHRVFGLCRRPPSPPLPSRVVPVFALAEIDAPLDAVINLAGENIGAQRWTASRRQVLRASRIGFTAQLGTALAARGQRPALWINASAVGYYGDRPGAVLAEDVPAADDFAARLCVDWETEARAAAQRVGARRLCLLRLGVVLGGGGLLAQLDRPFRLGVGAVMGPGHQHMAWISLDDVVAALRGALVDEAYDGVINLVAPQAVRQRDFADALARALHRPRWLRLPAAVLRPLLGQMADLVLFDQQVLPARLQALGFSFAYPELASALRRAVHRDA